MSDKYCVYIPKPGKVFIFANGYFNRNSKVEDQPNIHNDIELIEKTFANLGYDIQKKIEASSKEIEEHLTEIKSTDFSNYSCVIIFIDSNGDLDKIYGNDGKMVFVRRFFESFKQNQTLRDRSKLFFIDVCGGENIKKSETLACGNFISKSQANQEKNILNRYETAEDFKSSVNFLFIYYFKGSQYLHNRCNQVYNRNEETEQILQKIKNLILIEDSNEVKKQSEKNTSNLYQNTIKACTSTLRGHTDSVNCLELIDQYTLASGSCDTTIKLWNLKDKTCINSFEEHTNSIFCLQLIDKNTLASGSNNETIKFWNLKNSTCKNIIESGTILVRCFQLIDKNTLAIGTENFTIEIMNLKNSTCIYTLDAHKDSVRCLQLIDKDTLASGSCDANIKIWNLRNNTCIETLKGHIYSVWCLELIDTNTLASGSDDFTIKIWNLQNYNCINTLIGHTHSVWCLQLIDNNTLASGSSDTKIKIWNLKNNTCIDTLEGHQDSVCCFKLLDNRTLASGSDDNTIKIWNLISDQNLNT
ncbi:hypothetical protein BpHYR1_012466 [Brachionus plicatilis]|uniref:Caspase family p20 domain-containing protein n=1 Tax=Brachionus plicatilis TaxID=10195 RepID=A0A3M7Q3M1_BRAPC|nr:hypothetical protein BpHYR1_012466 [Brachionus plicatilis]